MLSWLKWLFGCYIGWHSWDEPFEKDYVKHLGPDVLFTTYGIQKGKRKCKYCNKIQTCCQKGLCGIGGVGFGWKYCSPENEKQIDSLPRM